MMETVRLRLLFDSRNLLSVSQRKDGLRRSWIVLKSQHNTISDLSSYILTFFHLHEACPYGLVLSMDGFVLPPFESTCILKDKDIVRVKRKACKVADVVRLDNGANSIELLETEERQPNDTDLKLLLNEEFEKEAGGYESESEEDEPNQLEDTLPVKNTPERKNVSRKRKSSEILHVPKRKKNKTTTEECLAVSTDVHHAYTEHDNNLHHLTVLTKKKLVMKDKSSNGHNEREKSSDPEVDGKSNDARKSASRVKSQLQGDLEGLDVSDTAGGSKKLPSRSARRKKAKRQWLREQVKAKKEEPPQKLVETITQQAPRTEDAKIPEEQQPAEDSEIEDDIVPVVIRPGHIRFEPIGKVVADPPVQRNQNTQAQESLQWNGITSKRRGQKWGREKTSSCKWNDHNNSREESSCTQTTKSKAHANSPIDFEKLKSCPGVPQKGDVVAYRLIELSSSWTPELTSFRVGKVSWYDSQSKRIMLIPVPEYPIVSKKEIDEESIIQPDTSPYGEDGSLKIDYSALIDLRIVKGNSYSSNTATDSANEVPVPNQALSGFQPNGHVESHAITHEKNGKANPWDEISQALSAKKVQLSQKDNWNKGESSGRSSWSYRGLRGSALGPTMALLRSQNEL